MLWLQGRFNANPIGARPRLRLDVGLCPTNMERCQQCDRLRRCRRRDDLTQEVSDACEPCQMVFAYDKVDVSRCEHIRAGCLGAHCESQHTSVVAGAAASFFATSSGLASAMQHSYLVRQVPHDR